MNRKDEATVARNKALGMASITQLHTYGRQLQLAGKQDEAFAVFRNNIKKDPNHWLVRTEAARLAVAKGDYDGATKEMKLALAAAPDPAKPTLEGFHQAPGGQSRTSINNLNASCGVCEIQPWL